MKERLTKPVVIRLDQVLQRHVQAMFSEGDPKGLIDDDDELDVVQVGEPVEDRWLSIRDRLQAST